MAPLLIDSRDLLKLGFISVLLTVIVFASGFFLGHQRAAAFYQAGSDVEVLLLPEQNEVTENIADFQSPSIVEAGENIDVDQPEVMTNVSLPLNKPMSDSVMASSQVRDVSSELIKASASQQVEHNERISKANKIPALEKAQIVIVHNDDSRVLKKSDVPIITTFTSDELNKIKYSIQVGMYGRLLNAENMVKRLKMQHYDAYVSDYTNKKNKIRYNVRFGYFADKKSALVMLNKFKTRQNGDGYLVKFTADNIVNIAGAAEVKQAADVPVHESKIDKTVIPVTAPSGMVQEISQADVLNNALIIAN